MKSTITCIAALLVMSIALPSFAADKVKGNGKIVTRTIPVDEFSDIRLGRNIESSSNIFGVFNKDKPSQPIFHYEQTNNNANLEITMDENLFEYLDIDQQSENLKIQSRSEEVKIVPTQLLVKGRSANLKRVEINGCMNFVAESKLKADNLHIVVSGVGDIKLSNLEGGTISCDVSGVGNAYLTGKANVGEFTLSGVGKVFAFDCSIKELQCDVSGVGKMEVYATDCLTVKTSGVGGVRYKGSATVSSSASGIGSIKRAE